MWHNLKQTAKIHRFDESEFIGFAKANINRFSLIEVGDSLQVNTWNADSLIEQFKSSIQGNKLICVEKTTI